MIVKTKKINLSKDFVTNGGFVLKNPQVAYEEYGEKEAPVIYVTHGGLSSMHAAGRYSESDIEAGWWDGIIGKAKAIDTAKFRVICSNALGSMFGTCGPLTINPETGVSYGATFPIIDFIDQARFHKAFLEELGINRVFILAGVSMGSMHNLQLAALYPDFCKGLVSVATAGRMPPSGIAMHNFMINALQMDPQYNEGNYLIGTPFLTLHLVHQVAKIYYTHERIIKKMTWDKIPDNSGSQIQRVNAINDYLVNGLDNIVTTRDANSYIRILQAINSHDLSLDDGDYETGVKRIQCKALLMNINTDQEFPPYWAKEVVDILNSNKENQAIFYEIDSDWGHLACLKETRVLSDKIRNFISMF